MSQSIVDPISDSATMISALEDPHDFPQIWQKPSRDSLMGCLESLRVLPPIWNFRIPRSEIIRSQDSTVQARRVVAGYLSNIIKSNLEWIADDDQREEIWNLASKRLSERCGRAAMGEITRQWPFFSNPAHPDFELIIKEPPLTGDNVGLKTWSSSYILAQKLTDFAQVTLSHFTSLSSRFKGENLTSVLELGSGTGLLGLAAASIWGTHVVLTDLPEILPNLKYNAEENRAAIEDLGGSVSVGALTWGGSGDEVDERFRKKHQFDLILAADAVYDDNHPELLASTINDQLAMTEDARALVMIPQRNKAIPSLTTSLVDILCSDDNSIELIQDGGVEGSDDWGDEMDEDRVFCYWCVFKRELKE